jgi:hypothetical protein
MSFYTPGQASYKLTYVLSPIILTGGVAQNIPGGMLPIISITQAQDFNTGLLSGANVDLDDYFAEFMPIPGGSIIDNSVGVYPFANQAVAANAIIANPLQVSMLMLCPIRYPASSYSSKQATMQALQSVLDQHNKSGGTYTIVTLSYTYTDCLMTGMRDVSSPESKQSQNAWRMDFVRPLLTLEQAQQAQNSLMSQITNGTPINGQPAYSGLSPTVGNPSSLAASSVVPAASNTGGAGVSGISPTLNTP